MKDTLKQLKMFPLTIIFFVFLVIFSIVDSLAPHREMSELENRPLAQQPTFTLQALLANEWTADYTEFIRDQFVFRDGWISMHSALEQAQGKLENGGVWFATDRYLIAQNMFFSTAQERLLPLNIQAVSQFAARNPGKVHSMVIPSPANIMSFRLRGRPHQVDENAYLQEIYAGLEAAGAQPIDLLPAYQTNKKEELYYRTDHHWTTDGGAWLAYVEVCNALGREAITPPEELRRETPGFLGTNFAQSKKFGTRPETIVWYDFPNQLRLYSYVGGVLQPGEPQGLMNMDSFKTNDMYGAFLHGILFGYTEIEGSGEGSILVVKDSYGNSFVPYLTQNYAKIGVVELRSLAPDDFTRIMEENQFDDILVMYSFNNFTSDNFIIRLSDR